ncbi:MAG: NAD-dependent epimerase/dehydratase family protein [candidate division KSB1 bacterium]|nr:NAD-dependent epimerase/dehydratase family protein [candidate division KSB1 bacterium]
MRALVTGATGFIGSILVEKLIERIKQHHNGSDSRIFCLVRQTSSLHWLQGLAVEFVRGDLFDKAALAAVLPEVTHVFHLAGATKAKSKAEYFRNNSEATRHLIQLCSNHARKLERFVYISSLAAAGPSRDGHLITEDEPPNPISIYGRSKLAGEQACQEFCQQLPITIVRPPVVYGPHDRDIYEYFKQVKMGIRLRLGSHERKISLIHVRDLVEGILRASESPKAIGETYFLTNLQPHELSELGRIIAARVMQKKTIEITVPERVAPVVAAVAELGAQITGKPALLNFDKVKEMREHYWVCSGEKAKQQLGFTPALSVEEGLRQTYWWYRDNGWL